MKTAIVKVKTAGAEWKTAIVKLISANAALKPVVVKAASEGLAGYLPGPVPELLI